MSIISITSVTPETFQKPRKLFFDIHLLGDAGEQTLVRDRRHISKLDSNGVSEKNWLSLVKSKDAPFRRVKSTRGVKHGMLRDQRGNDPWFVSLASAVPVKAYLISPLLTRSTNKLMVSLFYQLTSAKSRLRVFLVNPKFEPIKSFETQKGYVTHQRWKFAQLNIDLPPSFSRFHIIIEGHIEESSTKPCEVAIDEIYFQNLNDECPAPGSSILNCKFEKSLGYCNWNSSGDGPGYEDWMIESSGSEDEAINKYGFFESHLKGRGQVAGFDALGKSTQVDSYLRSRQVIAQSSCSCQVSMLYLVEGRLRMIPRLSLVMVYEHEERDVMLMSMTGYQDNVWHKIEAHISLDVGVPVYFEMRMTEITDSRPTFHIDDLVFHNCDFKLLEEDENSIDENKRSTRRA